MTDYGSDSAEPRQVPGDQPGDYGVAQQRSVGRSDPAPDAGNTADIDTLTADLTPDDDVYNRIDLINTQGPDTLREAPRQADDEC